MSKFTAGNSTDGGYGEKSYFDLQREALVHDVSMSMEQVLQNLNKLNRSLEGIIAVGNEFSSVEALWSYFETVMAKDPEEGQDEVEMMEEDAVEGPAPPVHERKRQ